MNIVDSTTVGFISERLHRITDTLQRYVDEGKLAGAVTLIARRNQIAYFECAGMMDIGAHKAMQRNTIFRIASMTKPITATALMMLFEEGLFQLDDPIADFIPAFDDAAVFVEETETGYETVKAQRPITIRDLFTHTSGIGLGAGASSPIEALYTRRVDELKQRGVTLQQAVEGLAELPLAHQPGSAWTYGLSYEVLACLVEVLSGDWFDVFLRERLYEPLGMTDTSHLIAPGSKDRLAALYQPTADGNIDVVETSDDSPHVLPPGCTYESGTGWTSGSGMLVSTAMDYARFATMLLNGGELEGVRLLSPKTVQMMTFNHLPAGMVPFAHVGYGHGLGVRVLMDVAQSGVLGSPGTFAGDGGHGTFFWADPHEKLIGLCMIQLQHSPYPLFQQLQTLTYQALTDMSR
jgi:CubicO group peptidase (beta-lactamase class C family)